MQIRPSKIYGSRSWDLENAAIEKAFAEGRGKLSPMRIYDAYRRRANRVRIAIRKLRKIYAKRRLAEAEKVKAEQEAVLIRRIYAAIPVMAGRTSRVDRKRNISLDTCLLVQAIYLTPGQMDRLARENGFTIGQLQQKISRIRRELAKLGIHVKKGW